MTVRHVAYYSVALIMLFVAVPLPAQEFPLAVGSDTTFCGGAVFGGLNGLVAIQGVVGNPNRITAQLVGEGGQLVGSRIDLGADGIMPGAIPVFDGTNYFLAWLEGNGSIKGQRVSTSGTVLGSPTTIATSVTFEHTPFRMIYADTVIWVFYVTTDGFLNVQRVGSDGVVIGEALRVSNNLARDFSIAYDGTNLLAAWVEMIPDTDKDVYGQFVSKAGSLVGSNFVIDNGPLFSDNPTSLAFDGARYLLGFHETPSMTHKWTLVGRFITPSGTVQESITICDSSTAPTFPSVAFAHGNYLITWMQRSNGSLMARFFNTSGVPVADPFEAFGPMGSKVPVGGGGFGGGLFLVVATRVDSNFTDGDVYGRFIQPLTGVEGPKGELPEGLTLRPNYPNPFNPSTNIAFDVPVSARVRLSMCDMLGREVAVVVDETMEAGAHEVRFDGSRLASGVYICRLAAGGLVRSRPLILAK